LSGESRARLEVAEDPIYLVRSPAFEGPIELLLNLAQRDQVDLHAISLGSLAEDYLHAIEEKRPPLDRMAAFLTIGSRLVQLKARHLMPAPSPAEEEDLEAWEDAIKGRLEEYRRFKQLATSIMERHASGNFTFAGLFEPEVVPQPSIRLDVDALAAAFQQVLSRLPPVQELAVELEKVSLAEKEDEIRRALRLQGETNFTSLFQKARTRVEAVVTFLALLELIRIGDVIVLQPQAFGEIRVRPRDNG
jgi:segregation and condensation protein A